MTRILILGGTTEASRLAWALADAGAPAVFSYAGRTLDPLSQPLPTRVGGFGGIEGLVRYLKDNDITHVVDATHPFAAQMSAHAVAACAEAGVELAGLERPPWTPGEGDNWTLVPDIAGAVAALPDSPTRIFLAIGKQHLAEFAERPEHFYLLRLVDAPTDPLPLPNCEYVVARGPFIESMDRALIERFGIELIVCKNGGGAGARAKLDAARTLGLPVIMIERPTLPKREVLTCTGEVMGWLRYHARLGV